MSRASACHGATDARFVHVRDRCDDIRQLSAVAPFAWSSLSLRRRGDVLEFQQVVGQPWRKAVGDVGWNGNELVAFRMHVPSEIPFHNAPSKQVRRGNILEWEQPLVERLKSVPARGRGQHGTGVDPLHDAVALRWRRSLLAAVAFGVRDLAGRPTRS